MQPKKPEKRLCIIVSINSHLPPHVCVCEFLCTRVRACVCKQNPSEQGAMAWNWREPTGRVSPWCRPPPLPLPLLILYHLSLLASEHDGEAGGGGGDAQSHVSGEMNRSAVPSVSHKLGSGRSCGTLSWDEQREEGRKQLLSVFLSLLHQLTCVFPYSVISSKAVISFCYTGFK